MAGKSTRACVAFGAVVVVAGCGKFLAGDPPEMPPDASFPEDSSPGDAAPDAVAPDDGACRLAPAPSCSPTSCPKLVLHDTAGARTAPWGIATSDKAVFWLEQPATNEGYNGNAMARVLRAPKDPSGGITTELALGQARAITLAVMGGWVYWTVYDVAVDQFARLRRVRTDCAGGCSPEELLVTTRGVRIMKLVPVGETTLFGIGEAGQIVRFDVGGAKMSMAGPLFEKPGFASLANTGHHVFVSSNNSPTLARMDLDGTNIDEKFLAVPSGDGGAEPGINSLWYDCQEKLWARRGPGTDLVSLSLADGQMHTVKAQAKLTVYDVGGDARYLYLAGANEGLFALDRQGSATLEPVGGVKVFAVAVDDAGVYWGEHDTDTPMAGTIYMLTK